MIEREVWWLVVVLLVIDASSLLFVDLVFGDEFGLFVDKDFWFVGFLVYVCGVWLVDVLVMFDVSGIYFYGDGFVYVYFFFVDEVGVNVIIGWWFVYGLWLVMVVELVLWDGVWYCLGDVCFDGRVGVVWWWVDGVE